MHDICKQIYSSRQIDIMKDFSFITNSHPSYIEGLYNDFINNPENVDQDLRKFFEGFDFAISHANGNGIGKAETATNAPVDSNTLNKEFGVYQLIQAYRKRGHLVATTNPIRDRKDRRANLDLKYFGLSDADL